jgi:hypothetical protein
MEASAASLQMIFEWDEEPGAEWVALAQACRTGEERDQAYERLVALHGVLREVCRVDWVDLELMERVRPVCGERAMALVWRAEMRTDGGARVTAEAVAFGLGLEKGELDG